MGAMVLVQLKIPVQLHQALKTRAKELDLGVADVGRWALSREIDSPTLRVKGSNVGAAIKMLAQGVGDTDEGLIELRTALKSVCTGG